MTLSEQQARILDFERSWWQSPWVKEREILGSLGLSPTRYYQLLNELIDLPEAAQFDPELVSRLRRRRAARAKLRGAGPGGHSADRGPGHPETPRTPMAPNPRWPGTPRSPGEN